MSDLSTGNASTRPTCQQRTRNVPATELSCKQKGSLEASIRQTHRVGVKRLPLSAACPVSTAAPTTTMVNHDEKGPYSLASALDAKMDHPSRGNCVVISSEPSVVPLLNAGSAKRPRMANPGETLTQPQQLLSQLPHKEPPGHQDHATLSVILVSQQASTPATPAPANLLPTAIAGTCMTMCGITRTEACIRLDDAVLEAPVVLSMPPSEAMVAMDSEAQGEPTTAVPSTGPACTSHTSVTRCEPHSYPLADAVQVSMTPTSAYAGSDTANISAPTADIGGGGCFVGCSPGMKLYMRLVGEASEDVAGVEHQRVGEGSRVWIKMAGYCHWPAVVFSLRYCRKSEIPDLLASYQPGRTLVHFYGSHDHVWASPSSLTPWITDQKVRLAALKAAARSSRVAASTLAELTGSLGINAASDPTRELARVVQMREAALGRPNMKRSGSRGGGGHGNKLVCGACGEGGSQITCTSCRTAFHTLCLPQPDVSPEHMLAAAAMEATLQTAAQAMSEQQLQKQPPTHQPQRPFLQQKAVWTCGACQRQNELQGTVRLNLMPHVTGARPEAGNPRARRREAVGGAGGVGCAATPSSSGSRDGIVNPQRPQGGQQQIGTQHTELLALYEWLLDKDAALEAAAAAASKGGDKKTGSPGKMKEAAAEAMDAVLVPGKDEPDESVFTAAEQQQSRGPTAVTATSAVLQPLPGTRLWVKTPGYCHWPAVVFSLRYCRKSEIPDLLASYQPGCTLVHFYGEHNHAWLPDTEVAALAAAAANPREEQERREGLVSWTSKRKKGALSGHMALAELDGPGKTVHKPLGRETMDGGTAASAASPVTFDSAIVDDKAAVSIDAAAAVSGAGRLKTPLPLFNTFTSSISDDPRREILRVVALREARLAEEEERREQAAWEMMLNGVREGAHTGITSRRGGGSGSGSGLGDPCSSASLAVGGTSMGSRYRSKVHETGVSGWRSRLMVCAACEEPGGQVICLNCRRAYHTLCLTPRWLSPVYMPPQQRWKCACCGNENELQQSSSGNQDGSGRTQEEERMGLTPDWIIMAGAFKVFQLPRPTAAAPYIRGLLDPCTNSKANPNIPAEKLYDKEDDGLRLSNSWAGYYVILNPEYTSQTQWRFVNRAIDEVENGSVPAVLLLCRNSTDTAYFQRLRPYPRVMLRRTSARFKDYDKTPIGFGVAVFCIAPRGPARAPLYQRFVAAFGDWGEPNIPIDAAFVDSPAFLDLLDRLADHTTRHMRDTWVQCSACRKWRIVPYEVYRLLDQQPQQQQEKNKLQEWVNGNNTGNDVPVLQDEGVEAVIHDVMGQRRLAGVWTCSQLGAGLGCASPQSRIEAAGVQYARQRVSQRPSHRGDAAEPQLPRWQQRQQQATKEEGGCIAHWEQQQGLGISQVLRPGAEQRLVLHNEPLAGGLPLDPWSLTVAGLLPPAAVVNGCDG
nr:hypothetical protein [Volvox reticuliferus]